MGNPTQICKDTLIQLFLDHLDHGNRTTDRKHQHSKYKNYMPYDCPWSFKESPNQFYFPEQLSAFYDPLCWAPQILNIVTFVNSMGIRVFPFAIMGV